MKRSLFVVTVASMGTALSLLGAGSALADTTPTATPSVTPSPSATPTASTTMVVPTLNDDADENDVEYGDTVTLMGTGQPGDTIGIFFHIYGQNGYDQRRSLVVPASGQYQVTYVGTKDERYYAVDESEATDNRYSSDPGLTTVAPEVVVSPAPSDDDTLRVRKGTTITVSGVSTSGPAVEIGFYTGPVDGNIATIKPGDFFVRTVPVNGPNGTFRRTFIANRNYVFGVVGANGDESDDIELTVTK